MYGDPGDLAYPEEWEEPSTAAPSRVGTAAGEAPSRPPTGAEAQSRGATRAAHGQGAAEGAAGGAGGGRRGEGRPAGEREGARRGTRAEDAGLRALAEALRLLDALQGGGDARVRAVLEEALRGAAEAPRGGGAPGTGAGSREGRLRAWMRAVEPPPPPPPSRTKWTRLVHPSVPSGHVSSIPPY